MTLQNRVTPTGEIVSSPERGTLMGNRGGCLHDGERRLGTRRWASKAWIACLLDFRGRRRIPMTPGRYTELFFLDEATVLAAGHRPCFECRRTHARAFAKAWAEGNGLDEPPRAGDMDTILHEERVGPRRGKRCAVLDTATLPDGTMVLLDRMPHLVIGRCGRPWSLSGYGPPVPLPAGPVEVATPPSTVGALRAGYRAATHRSAQAWTA